MPKQTKLNKICNIQISDYSAITPGGMNWSDTWDSLLHCDIAERTIPQWPCTIDLPIGVNSIPKLNRKYSKRGACARLIDEVMDSLLQLPESYGLYIGSAHSETDILLYLLRSELGLESNKSNLWPKVLIDPLQDFCQKSMISTSSLVYSACTSGMHALSAAQLDLATGKVDAALVVSADALSVFGIAGFYRTGAMTNYPCQPFADSAKGTIVSEGAAAILLKRSTKNKKGEVRLLSIGISCDAGHPTLPDPHGAGLERAWRQAISNAGIQFGDIGAIVLHGSGTKANDSVEASVYERLFMESLPLTTSIKGVIGHTMGASGLHNCLVAIEALKTGIIPPVSTNSSQINSPINLVLNMQQYIDTAKPILVSCSGFGGNNVAVILGINT